VTTGGPAIWTDPRWRREIEAWARDDLARLGRTVDGPIEQPHVRPWSTVLRLATDRGVVWCKASASGTAHEARLLPAFAAWGIRHVQLPLAADPDRGWLLFDDGGPTLRSSRPDVAGDTDLQAWEGILATYGELQRSLEERTGELVRMGVPDRRPAALPATLARLVEHDAWWDLVGPDDRPAAEAARNRLSGLASWVAEAAHDLERSGIAATIQHDDLHGNNVFVGPPGVRFFDWGDSVVAHPFGTLLTTLRSVGRRLEVDPDGPAFGRLRDAYLEAWTDVLPRSALGDVLSSALTLARIGKAAAWARALGDVAPADMDGHGDAPAMWLVDLVDVLDRRSG
jgi:hypothetical protein